jgi:hypothetical protein
MISRKTTPNAIGIQQVGGATRTRTPRDVMPKRNMGGRRPTGMVVCALLDGDSSRLGSHAGLWPRKFG